MSTRMANAERRAMTHCHKGHPFDEKNTYWRGTTRTCRACNAAAVRAYAASRRGTTPPLPTRIADDLAFMRLVRVEAGCWIWIAAVGKSGYGRVTRSGRRLRAHRYAWMVERGEIPDGLVLDHLCRNRACVNVDHLEPVTISENGRRSSLVGEWELRITHCPQGHPYDGLNTWTNSKGHRYCRACKVERRRAGKKVA